MDPYDFDYEPSRKSISVPQQSKGSKGKKQKQPKQKAAAPSGGHLSTAATAGSSSSSSKRFTSPLGVGKEDVHKARNVSRKSKLFRQFGVAESSEDDDDISEQRSTLPTSNSSSSSTTSTNNIRYPPPPAFLRSTSAGRRGIASSIGSDSIKSKALANLSSTRTKSPNKLFASSPNNNNNVESTTTASISSPLPESHHQQLVYSPYYRALFGSQNHIETDQPTSPGTQLDQDQDVDTALAALADYKLTISTVSNSPSSEDTSSSDDETCRINGLRTPASNKTLVTPFKAHRNSHNTLGQDHAMLVASPSIFSPEVIKSINRTGLLSTVTSEEDDSSGGDKDNNTTADECGITSIQYQTVGVVIGEELWPALPTPGKQLKTPLANKHKASMLRTPSSRTPLSMSRNSSHNHNLNVLEESAVNNNNGNSSSTNTMYLSRKLSSPPPIMPNSSNQTHAANSVSNGFVSIAQSPFKQTLSPALFPSNAVSSTEEVLTPSVSRVFSPSPPLLVRNVSTGKSLGMASYLDFCNAGNLPNPNAVAIVDIMRVSRQLHDRFIASKLPLNTAVQASANKRVKCWDEADSESEGEEEEGEEEFLEDEYLYQDLLSLLEDFRVPRPRGWRVDVTQDEATALQLQAIGKGRKALFLFNLPTPTTATTTTPSKRKKRGVDITMPKVRYHLIDFLYFHTSVQQYLSTAYVLQNKLEQQGVTNSLTSSFEKSNNQSMLHTFNNTSSSGLLLHGGNTSSSSLHVCNIATEKVTERGTGDLLTEALQAQFYYHAIHQLTQEDDQRFDSLNLELMKILYLHAVNESDPNEAEDDLAQDEAVGLDVSQSSEDFQRMKQQQKKVFLPWVGSKSRVLILDAVLSASEERRQRCETFSLHAQQLEMDINFLAKRNYGPWLTSTCSIAMKQTLQREYSMLAIVKSTDERPPFKVQDHDRLLLDLLKFVIKIEVKNAVNLLMDHTECNDAFAFSMKLFQRVFQSHVNILRCYGHRLGQRSELIENNAMLTALLEVTEGILVWSALLMMQRDLLFVDSDDHVNEVDAASRYLQFLVKHWTSLQRNDNSNNKEEDREEGGLNYAQEILFVKLLDVVLPFFKPVVVPSSENEDGDQRGLDVITKALQRVRHSHKRVNNNIVSLRLVLQKVLQRLQFSEHVKVVNTILTFLQEIDLLTSFFLSSSDMAQDSVSLQDENANRLTDLVEILRNLRKQHWNPSIQQQASLCLDFILQAIAKDEEDLSEEENDEE